MRNDATASAPTPRRPQAIPSTAMERVMTGSKNRRTGTDRRQRRVREATRRKQQLPVSIERRSGMDRRARDRRGGKDRRRD